MDEMITLSEHQLHNMMCDVARRTAQQVLIQTGVIKPMIKASECYRLAGSRRKVDRAIADGKLKWVKKGVNTLIFRDSFEAWQQKCEWK